MNNRLRTLVFTGIGLLAIVVTVLIVAPRNNATGLEKLGKLPANFAVSTEYGSDGLLFSNGRSFVNYDYKTGKSTLLSADAYNQPLEGIDQIMLSQNKQYIVFHLPLVAPSSTLETQLTDQGLSTDNDYWWVYDIASQTYKNFPAGVTNVQVSGNEAVGQTGSDQSTITTFSLPDLNQTSSVHTSASSNFFKTKDGYLLTSDEGNDVYFTRDGVVSDKIFSSADIIGMTSDKASAIGTSSQNGSTYLVRYDISTKQQVVLDTDVNSQVGYIGGNKILYRKADPKKFYVYDLTTKKTDAFKIDVKDAPDSLVPEALLDNGSFLLSDKNNSMYVAGNTAAHTKFMTSYNKTVSTSSNPIDVQYFADDNDIVATINKSTADADRASVYAQLKKDGYDPNLIDIQFVLFVPTQGTL
jgi:hypothetical protein